MCGPAMGGKYFTEALSHKKRMGGGGYLEFYSGPFAIIKQQMCRAPVFIHERSLVNPLCIQNRYSVTTGKGYK
jgi:hypothetical protein